MAINHIDIAASLHQVNQVIERNTEPLPVISVDPYSAFVTVVEGKLAERVHVPGIVVAGQDERFAQGVYWGRCMYFETVDVEVDAAMGERMTEGFTLADIESGRVRQVKQSDITAAEVVSVMGEIHDEEVDPVFHAGLMVGYIQAASDCYFGQACEQCGNHRRFCPGHPGRLMSSL